FGPYRIESVVGRGGMGVVYLALDERLGRKVALKLLNPELAADATFQSRFRHEARLAASIDHPHLLPIYESGELGGELFLAMRYVPGVDLGTYLAQHGPLDLEASLALLGQVASALEAAHSTGLVHRDVKPANILIGPGDYAYLTDFGLARPPATASYAGLTNAGQLLGT